MDGFNKIASGYTTPFSVPPEWKIAGTGDFNGDGKSDLLWRRDNGEVSIWMMDGLTKLPGGYTNPAFAIPIEWKISGTGDFNGDGMSDILWRRDNGEVSVWLMNGFTGHERGYTSPFAVPTEWKIVDIVDLNGDGKSDLTWRNEAGDLSTWMMDGRTVVSGGGVVQNISNYWQIVGAQQGALGSDSPPPPAATNDVIEGTTGNDLLSDPSGKNYFNGGSGNDTLTGGFGNDFLIGENGNDVINPGIGKDVIALNVGDGQDTVLSNTGTDNTVSVGSEDDSLDYDNCFFSKNNNDLVFNITASDNLTFKDWYLSPANRNVLNLQVIAEAMGAFEAAGANPLLDNKVELFDFQTLTDAFDLARSADATLTQWALTNALLDAHLTGSDTDAIGGDLTYLYGLNGTLADNSISSVGTLLGSSNFGSSAQPLHTLSGATDPKLAL
jgi:hypothetical protein